MSFSTLRLTSIGEALGRLWGDVFLQLDVPTFLFSVTLKPNVGTWAGDSKSSRLLGTGRLLARTAGPASPQQGGRTPALDRAGEERLPLAPRPGPDQGSRAVSSAHPGDLGCQRQGRVTELEAALRGPSRPRLHVRGPRGVWTASAGPSPAAQPSTSVPQVTSGCLRFNTSDPNVCHLPSGSQGRGKRAAAAPSATVAALTEGLRCAGCRACVTPRALTAPAWPLRL